MAWKLEQIKGDLGHGKKDVPVQSETEKYCFLPFYSICVLIGLVVLTHMGKRGFLMILVNFYVYSMSWSITVEFYAKYCILATLCSPILEIPDIFLAPKKGSERPVKENVYKTLYISLSGASPPTPIHRELKSDFLETVPVKGWGLTLAQHEPFREYTVQTVVERSNDVWVESEKA